MATRVFISQPMGGLSELGIEQLRSRILDWAPRVIGMDECLVEIPKMAKWQADSSHPVYCLGHSIQDMSRANVVIFAPGWDKARGCLVENAVCKAYKIPHIELEVDENGYLKVARREAYADG